MAALLCRDSSVSNTDPDNEEEDDDEEQEEGTHEGTQLTDNAEGTLAWERATATKKGPKKKKKKSEGASVNTWARCLTLHFIIAAFVASQVSMLTFCTSLKALHWFVHFSSTTQRVSVCS